MISTLPLLFAAALVGTPVEFSLPSGGTYLVSLAVVEKEHPERIVSTFVAGEAFDSTVSNRYTVSWNGLDENFMPVPPGEYGLKGIYSPTTVWPVDGKPHAISARWAGGPGAFLPDPTDDEAALKPLPFYGDPVNSPLLDIDTTADGKAVLGFQYLENGRSCPLLDLTQSKGYAQFVAAYPSGGAGGGPCACTDGIDVWACTVDGAPWFVYRPDMKSFGSDNVSYRRGGYLPSGVVTDMAAVKGALRTVVYIVERGTIEAYTPSWGGTAWRESATARTDVITALDGADGAFVGRTSVPHPQAIKPGSGCLYVLYKPDGVKLAIGRMTLVNEVPQTVEKLFDVPAEISPLDFAVDSAAKSFFFADPSQNKLFRVTRTETTSGKGKNQTTTITYPVDLTAGRLAQQASGSYDSESLMAPARLALWCDTAGRERVLVVEQDGPNRISEWDASTLAYLGDYQNYQLKANCGFAVDPANARHVYIPGHNGWMNRFDVDPATGKWTIDAVFANVPDDGESGLAKMKCFRVNGRLYFASGLSGAVFRLTDNGREIVRAGSVKNAPNPPGGVFTYHGQNYLDDLTYLAIAQNARDVWRCRPEVAANGDLTYATWEKVLADPVFEARANGTATALFGGNELAETFSSDWMQADAFPNGDVYVHASGGPNYSANFRPQHKISRYRPNGAGGYDLVWRVGRTKLPGNVKANGELSGGMRLFKPMNGILAVIDQSLSGVFLYTEDGLYVDTLFPDGDAIAMSAYNQPGEFFVGLIFADAATGKIRYGSGKYTPFLYDIRGWSLTENPTRPVTFSSDSVRLTVAATADPPAEAVRLRQAEGQVPFATVRPATGGWDGAEPIRYADGEDAVEVRVLYTPDALRVRWQVRKGTVVEPKRIDALETMFTHDQGVDTVSLYLQCDPTDVSTPPTGGRAADVRFTFGVVQDGAGAPTVAGIVFHPVWTGAGTNAQTYQTVAGGTAQFAHVGAAPGVTANLTMDDDAHGFTIEATIPRTALPVAGPFAEGFRTALNFDANLGGHHRFWWANADGSASRETYDAPTEARFYPGAWGLCAFSGLAEGLYLRTWAAIGPFGGPGTEGWSYDPSPEQKQPVFDYFTAAEYGPDSEFEPSPETVYTGETLRGWWENPAERLSWTPVNPPPTDVRVTLGLGAQVWYATTAIHTPAAAEVTLELLGSFMSYPRWTLNGEPVDPGAFAEFPAYEGAVKATTRVTLREGWNVLTCRAFCNGYPPFKVGARIVADEATLWHLTNRAFVSELDPDPDPTEPVIEEVELDRADCANLSLAAQRGQLAVDNDHATVTSENWTLRAGSTIELLCTHNGGPMQFVNAGTLDLKESTLLYRYAVGNHNTSNGPRNFINEGTWRQEAASFAFEAREPEVSTGAYGYLMNCANNGTMTLVNGSTLMFFNLINAGRLTAGDGTVLGCPINSSTQLTNESTGEIDMTGSVVLGSSPSVPGDGIVVENRGRLAIGSDETPAQVLFAGTGVRVTNTETGTLTVDNGSSLTMRYHGDQSPMTFENVGMVVQNGGALTFDWAADRQNTGRRFWRNSGTWTLTNGASFEMMSSTGREVWWFTEGVAEPALNTGVIAADGATFANTPLQNHGDLMVGPNGLVFTDKCLSLFGEANGGRLVFQLGADPSQVGRLAVSGGWQSELKLEDDDCVLEIRLPDDMKPWTGERTIRLITAPQCQAGSIKDKTFGTVRAVRANGSTAGVKVLSVAYMADGVDVTLNVSEGGLIKKGVIIVFR